MIIKTYYYVNATDQIESTDLIDDYVTMLVSGTIKPINSEQAAKLKLEKSYLSDVKKAISSYEGKVPLYDIGTNRIYLIYKENIYPRIHFDAYRFVDRSMAEYSEELINPDENDKDNIRIIKLYDLDVLHETYLKIFYESFVLNSYITSCRRPSFASHMEHITPYYNMRELYFFAYDWDLSTSLKLSNDEIRKICSTITQYDISAKTLLDHQIYIYDSKAIGLVKHYSLFGSYYMNVYLRKNKCCLPQKNTYPDAIRNLNLENQINIMIKLIKNAPAFVAAHTVYRFIEQDTYMKHLKIGDLYQDASFMSTTRNPFYGEEHYAFGNIMIKIKIPANIKGIGLCIESYSNFPPEEEIILPPSSIYRLDKITEGKESISFHNIFGLGVPVQRKYEFTLMGNDYLSKADADVGIEMPGAYVPELKVFDMRDLLTDENVKNTSMSDRLKYFRDTYTNMVNQFKSTVGTNEYIFSFEAYDSTNVYRPFFFYEVDDGILITTSNPRYGNINIFIEIGPEIHINYYFRFSVTDPSIVVDLNREEWIEWFSLLAFALGRKTVIFHSNYVLNFDKADPIETKQLKTRYTFSQNIYLYMKQKKRLFEYMEITPQFDYFQLDYLFDLPVADVVKIIDKNELFRIHQQTNSTIKNMGDFYLYIVENIPRMIKPLEEKLNDVFEPEKNPFNHISYQLDAWLYLYNKDFIKHIPSDKEFVIRKGSNRKLIGDKKIPKFKNRLREYLAGPKTTK